MIQASHDTLRVICDSKRNHIAAQKEKISTPQLQQLLASVLPSRGFAATLTTKAQQGEIALIAEIKKASPSKGIIRKDFDPAAHAIAYEQAGACCLSVLTDTPYFQGMDDYLPLARNSVRLPVLRKDFMLDPYQILESRVLGADAILLIMAALSDTQAQELESAAFTYGMDVLVEVHDEYEMDRALTHLKSPLIGINNRNLKTLQVDIRTTERLRPYIPHTHIVICESGISCHADIMRMQTHHVHCFLVGESLMLQSDLEKATRLLLGTIPH